MVGEPIVLLSHGLKANTEDCRLLDDLACAPITDLSDDVFFDSAELEKVTGIDPYEVHLGRLMYLWLISNSPVSIPYQRKDWKRFRRKEGLDKDMDRRGVEEGVRNDNEIQASLDT